MEAVYNTFVLTKKGAALLNRAQLGLCQMEFLDAQTGDGVWDDKTVDTLKEAEALRHFIRGFPISATQVIDETTIMVGIQFNNMDITTGFYINEIGLFAREKNIPGTEILYALAVCSGEHGSFIPTYTGHNPVSINQQFYITVDDSLEAIINVGSQYMLYDPEGVLGTPGALVPMQSLSDFFARHAKECKECSMESIAEIIQSAWSIHHEDDDDTGQIDDDGTIIEEATDDEVNDVINSLWND